MKNLNYKKTLAFLYKKLNNTPIAIKEAKMLHTLCDKFDKIYGIIYNKDTCRDTGDLNCSIRVNKDNCQASWFRPVSCFI